MDAIDEIKKLYYGATKATIQNDIARAIDLLKSMSSDEERERAAVYMDGLSQMRSEWTGRAGGAASRTPASRRSESSRSASAPPDGAARERSGRSPASSRRRR
jgi:hypothetical protein